MYQQIQKELRICIIPLGPGVAQGTWVHQQLVLQFKDYLTPDSFLLGPLFQGMAPQVSIRASVVLLSHFPMPLLVSLPTDTIRCISCLGSAVAFHPISLLPAPLVTHPLSLLRPERSIKMTNKKLRCSPQKQTVFKDDDKIQTFNSVTITMPNIQS